MTKMIKKEEFEVIGKIVERADKMNLLMFDRISLMMDLEVVTEQFNLKLKELLATDNFNFAHDIVGIQNNLNRQTKTVENCFLPRFSNQNSLPDEC